MEEVIAGGLWANLSELWTNSPAVPFLIVYTLGLYLGLTALLRIGGNRKTIDDNTAVLKKIEAGMEAPVAGQAEIIRFLKAGAPPGSAATGVQPPAAAIGDGGNRDARIEALGDEVERLRAEIEALKGGTSGTRR